MVGFRPGFPFGLPVSVTEMEEGSFNPGTKLPEAETGVLVEVGEVEDDGDWQDSNDVMIVGVGVNRDRFAVAAVAVTGAALDSPRPREGIPISKSGTGRVGNGSGY